MQKTVETSKFFCHNKKMNERIRNAYTKEESEKYKQIILYAIKSGAGVDGKIPKTKLAKEVCLADFIWFYEKNVSMSGMEYRKRTYGPVSDAFFRLVEEMEQEGIIKCESKSRRQDKDRILKLYSMKESEGNFDKLSSEEKTLIQQIGEAWKEASATEIVDFTHKQLPWQICRDEEVIPYSLITQEEPENVYGPLELYGRI